MKKLLLLLLCVPLMFSCGEKDKKNNTKNSSENQNNDLFFIGKWESASKSEDIKDEESLTSEDNKFIVFNNDKTGSLPGFGKNRISMIWDTISNTNNIDYGIEYTYEWIKGKETKKGVIKYIDENSIMLDDEEGETNFIRKQ